MKRDPVIAVVTVLGATAFLFWPITAALLIGADPPWFEWDVPEQYWPDLVYVCESLHEGGLPLWNPYDRLGYPFYADPQAASYHPLTWLTCAVGGPAPVLDWAVLRVLLGFAMSGLFGLLWLRRLGAPWSGATVGAVLIEAAPFMRHNWELNLTTALAYMPLMLWAADRVAVERKVWDGALLALAVALCGWVGSPPALFFASGLTALYLVFRLASSGPGWTRALPGVGVAVILGAGLLAVVLVPTAQLAEHSVQAGRSLESIADGALSPRRMVAAVWPQAGNHLYVGWLALAAIPFALRAKKRALAGFFVGVWALALLLAMGTHGPLFELAFALVPGVDRFRLPHRYEAWIGPAAGAMFALAAGTLQHARAAPRDDRRTRSAGGLLLGLGFGLAVGLDARGPGALLGAVGAVLLARGLAPPWDLKGAPLGAVLVLFVLADVSQSLPPERHLREGPPPVQADGTLLRHVEGDDHLMLEFGVCCRGGTRHRLPDLRGYQDPLALRSWSAVMGRLRETPELAPQFNVRWVIAGPHFIHGWERHFLPRPADLRDALRATRPFRDEREREVIELRDAVPPAYFVPAVEIERVRDRESALERVAELAPAAVAVLEGEPTGRGRARATAIPVARPTDFERRPDGVSLTLWAPSDGAVVINEAYYPGWTATVDGRPARVVRANGFVRAVRVRQGESAIELSFEPAEAGPLRAVWGLSWLVALALLAEGLRRRLRSRGPRTRSRA